MITVQLHESADAFEGLRSEWDALLARGRKPSVFRTWAWQDAWWRRFGETRELRLFAARDGTGALVGLAPLCLEREGTLAPTRALRFLGTERVSSEYLDILLAGDVETSAAEALLDAVERAPGWDQLDLTDLDEDAAVLRHWEPRLQNRGFDLHRSVSQEIPYLPLPESVAHLRRGFGHSLRGALARATRCLAAAGYAYRVETDPARIANLLDRLYDLHAARWAARDRPGNFRDERVRAFHGDLAATLGSAGALRLGMLAGTDRILAMLYALEWGGVVSYYQSGFDPEPPPGVKPSDYSPGLVLIGRALEEAVERGGSEFDFLRGDEPYKRRWTGLRRRTWGLLAIRPSALRARGRARVLRWARASRSRVKRLLVGPEHAPPRARRGARNQTAPPRPIRVVHVLEELQLAGMETGVIKVVNRLPASIEATICCLRRQAEVTKPAVDPRVRVLELGRGASHDYGVVATLARLFRRERAQVVHSHNWQTYLYSVLAARLAGVPVIVHGEHGHDGLPPSRRRLLVRRALAPLVTRFVTVSEDLARELRTVWRLDAGAILAIANGVDLARFDARADGRDVRRELGIAPEDDVVVSVGGIRRVKDYATLLRAFAQVRAARPAARLLIVGAACDETLQDELASLAGSLGVRDRVLFTGIRRDVPEVLAAADVYVNSSRFEGMSNTILEAMAMGKPVVATRVGGNAELVRDGVTGCLVPAEDPVALAAAVEGLLADPVRRARLGAAGRAHVERRHSMEAMVARYVDVYERAFDRWWTSRRSR